MLEKVKQKSGSISTGMRKAESRMKVITGIQNAVADCQQHNILLGRRYKNRRELCSCINPEMLVKYQ